ncbi:hypothetical protein D3C85_1775150 [compost metagenome]
MDQFLHETAFLFPDQHGFVVDAEFEWLVFEDLLEHIFQFCILYVDVYFVRIFQ